MPFLELEGQPDLENNPRELSGETVVGSAAQAGWRIPGQHLAARHFTISVREDGTARVLPASPHHVVVLNRKQVPPEGTTLGSGDVLAAGSARFIYLAERDSARPTAAPSVEAHLIDATSKRGYALGKRVVQIGREIGCSIVLKDPTVSRFHADIRSEGGEYVLYSMGSSGTRVNDQIVTFPRMLEDGDRIAMGATLFTFVRGPLPPDVLLAQLEDRDAASSRRSTQLAQRALTAGLGKHPPRRRRRWRTMAYAMYAIGGAVVMALGALYFAARR